MKTNVRTNSRFIVKPEDRVVICKMAVNMKLLDLECWHRIATVWETKAPMVNDFGKFTVIAKAKCNSNDTFDEAIGKRIAEARAKVKAFKIAKNVWSCIAKDFAEHTQIAKRMMKSCEEVEKIELKHESEILR